MFLSWVLADGEEAFAYPADDSQRVGGRFIGIFHAMMR
jgi:hypothetical protein